jgi:hypothetical protein
MRASILRTLAYADIFDYPLTLEEINYWLIGTKAKYTSGVYLSALPMVENSSGFYFLTGRGKIVTIRQHRARWSQAKLKLAAKVGDWLKIIPTIQLVAVTGALAMSNSAITDDIDLMIVTAPGTLWLTRPLVVLFVSLIAKRRTPAKNYSNAICLNLWLDATALAVAKSQRNLYTAHEVAQVKPLWDRHHTYAHFLSANSWISNYLPNIPIPKTKKLITYHLSLITILNRLAFRLQLWYMRPRLTRERVSVHAAFFHPRDTGRLIMRQYRHRDSNY